MKSVLGIVVIIFFVLFVFVAIGSFFFNIYKIIEALTNHFFRDYINKKLLWEKLKPGYKTVLQEYSSYYNNLSYIDKAHFERRVQKFINMKSFIPRGDLKKVTVEMKAMIACCAIQITFGYPGVYFSYFDRILIYTDNYYSNITRKYHQGEVSTRGYIILSWHNFVKGYSDLEDGRNLGIHEMAHALMLENAFYNYEYNFLDFEAVKEFNIRAHEEIDRIRNGETSFFRAYAGTNMHEFFAVSVEYFFEKTQELYNYDPVLYHLMTRLLLQDPLNKKVQQLVS